MRVSMLAPYYVLTLLPFGFLDTFFLDSEDPVDSLTTGSTSEISLLGLLISVTPILMA